MQGFITRDLYPTKDLKERKLMQLQHNEENQIRWDRDEMYEVDVYCHSSSRSNRL